MLSSQFIEVILKENLDFDTLFPQLTEEVKVALINITTGLPQCLDSNNFPSLGCENEINGVSNVMSSVTYLSCLLKKVCYKNDTANLVQFANCLATLSAARVRFILEDVKRNLTEKVIECITSISSYSRLGVINCDLIDNILKLDIKSALDHIETNIIEKIKTSFVTLLKILSGDMEAKCVNPNKIL
ncbi:uncharacterized protein LOC111614624 [Centruroides sculpturatus]|uniref:uncharacterized protein LOC111614624 n=1 Tax=Centruroides sculpturatus TaxID=218467 RepID=UPI000C6E89F6|nr:uncharacterized protein LOC111614624 [Centruroides sculpturatus]